MDFVQFLAKQALCIIESSKVNQEKNYVQKGRAQQGREHPLP